MVRRWSKQKKETTRLGTAAQDLFGNIPHEDKFNLYSEGQVDGKKVVDFLDYKKRDVAVAANIPVKSVRYDNKMPAALKERLREWAIAINLVGIYFNYEHKTMLWFDTTNPLLGNISPKAMIRAGRFRKLIRFIQTALEENTR